ncbi:DUF5082 domain-containing protein [Oceanobacillus kimchii]|uniref:YwqH-like family protein n=1 Tax=Oceanobacillus kimchii TaxID=746691 RepID=UPI0003491961|nr:DUF5082 family protein [Oceanobacillus kimchii]MCT1576499.1 DUF5082 domain-containing protein [Oceanobacillus kimchii]MCT2136135.1 DUF5082 domain-containing protein [Oceanobacillus kimchii]
MSSNLTTLRAQRHSIKDGINFSRSEANSWDDKVNRLQHSANQLEASIKKMDATNRNIESLEVDKRRWKGKEENKFSDNYNVYQSDVRSFITRTKDSKNIIEEEIIRAETKRDNYLSGIDQLNRSLVSIESQIAIEERK